jgi:hypothetical protein
MGLKCPRSYVLDRGRAECFDSGAIARISRRQRARGSNYLYVSDMSTSFNFCAYDNDTADHRPVKSHLINDD